MLRADMPHPPDPSDPLELVELRGLVERGGDALRVEVLGEAACGERRLPVLAVALGSDDPQAPALAVTGGVHGLERIGAQVANAFLATLLARLRWDEVLASALDRVRIVVVPVVNPGGLVLGTRANPAGVDLMRNAPVAAEESVPWLVGGQRIGPWLPWYRGRADQPMQPESAALCGFVERELLDRPFVLSVDCHSGFGVRDRLWFPFAHSSRPLPHLAEVVAFADLLDASQPQHRYLVEPQSVQYLAHGDLWDHLYLQACARGRGVFLPFTLEMGSWGWVRKNPRQLLRRHGLFDPMVAHRRDRALRRHVGWLDFALRAVAGHRRWLPAPAEREALALRGQARWWPAGART